MSGCKRLKTDSKSDVFQQPTKHHDFRSCTDKSMLSTKSFFISSVVIVLKVFKSENSIQNPLTDRSRNNTKNRVALSGTNLPFSWAKNARSLNIFLKIKIGRAILCALLHGPTNPDFQENVQGASILGPTEADFSFCIPTAKEFFEGTFNS